MVAGALPGTPLGAHDTPRSKSGFAGTQVGRAIEKVGNPCYKIAPIDDSWQDSLAIHGTLVTYLYINNTVATVD
jgi:hypothetical protein